ncbi:periplasmic binding protein-like II [Anaeromyces robustus]|uniref:Periplasmic binding protein-like II n=1 Tax=Anaeromyces robustus TaxID=1754192 RepID=A0A1Y1X385_9FUNG|nr:periplasmic binding protein-like II [Anaeromyces robustus]|eukprot:ORX80267.1 periplasmic binding protein-like II [Anaeromyces robustus]
MKFNFKSLLILHLFCLIGKIKGIKLLTTVLVYSNYDSTYTPMAKRFNEYAKEHNMDIEVEVELFLRSNSSLFVDDYGSQIEHLLKKRSTKYDLFFYDVIYTPRYSPYFVDLRDYLPEEHIANYSLGISSESCTHNGKWVGLHFSVTNSYLYSNYYYLNKYNKTIPQTWDELFETAKYIIEKEKEEGNKIIGYNGHFPDYETAISSAQEVIYSFRKTVDSPYPDYTSQEALDALNKLKEIKETLSNDDIFKEDDNYLFWKNILFIKYWNTAFAPYYNKTLLVGNKKGVSASTIGGSLIGINKYISEERIRAAAEFVRYITSYEIQKEKIMYSKGYTTLTPLYDDEEVCQYVDCELGKKVQPIIRPSNLTDNYDKYSTQFRKYFSDFLFGNKTAEETLTRINDITGIYYVTLDNKENYAIVLIILIITIIIITIMTLSLIFLLINRYKSWFSFLSADLWLIIYFGLMISIGPIILRYGEITHIKCHLGYSYLALGYNLIYIPILYKLIVNFQVKNKLTTWIQKNKYLFLVIFILIDLIFIILLYLLNPNYVVTNIIDEGKNFKYCKITSTAGKLIFTTLFAEKLLIFLCILMFIFMEWSLKKTSTDLKLILSAIYTNALILIVSYITHFINYKDYINKFILDTSIKLFYVFSNYIYLYGIRTILPFVLNNKEAAERDKYLKKIITSRSSNSHTKTNLIATENNSKNKFSIITSKIMDFHYTTGEEELTISDDVSVPTAPQIQKSNVMQ